MYLFIDTDPGIDDILALIYLFSKSEYDIVGVSSVAGNLSIEVTTKNLQFITGIFNKKYNRNVTLFKGISKPIVQVNNFDARDVHGQDGFGGFWKSDYATMHSSEIDDYCKYCTISDIPAAFALIELSRKYCGELVIIAIGPLGNIALAQIIDPLFGSRIKELFVMGGEITGRGNVSMYPSSEFNFSVDPEAAYVVFKELVCKKTILPLEPVEIVSIYPDKCQVWLENLNSKNDILSIIKRQCLLHRYQRTKSFRLYDLILIVLYMNPKFITEIMTVRAAIELKGKYTRGHVVLDSYNKTSENILQGFSEVNFIKSLNQEEIFQIYDTFFD